MIRSLIKSTTLELAVEGIARVMLSTVKANPGKRAYQLGLIAFGSGPNDIDCPDHKNMLTWAALCELEKRGEIRRHHHINWADCLQLKPTNRDPLTHQVHNSRTSSGRHCASDA